MQRNGIGDKVSDYKFTVSDELSSIDTEDLWVYNKMILSQVMGYVSGPAGLEVPSPDFYIVRPCMNFMGMGRFSRKEYLSDSTEHLHPGEFWCEIFEGRHISIDYYQRTPALVVEGLRGAQEPLYQWKQWVKVDYSIPFPEVLMGVSNKYDWINCEFIGDKLIEVHFRRNPDFRYGNDSVTPIWEGDEIPDGVQYIQDEDYKRKGFILDGPRIHEGDCK